MGTILVLEDDVNLAELYREELEDEGYAVLVAHDGAAALQLASSASPEVIVMDLHLRQAPALDGPSTLDAIQTKFPRTLVVINTAYFSATDDLRGRAVRAFVRKSSDLSDLKARVCECIHGPALKTALA